MSDYDFNPVTTPAADDRSDDFDDGDGGIDEFLEEAPARPREGLPSTFRMRHAPHYVEQLMGEAPIQTVRQIPVEQIAAPAIDDRQVSALAESIREVGLLQPILVIRQGASSFELVAGANRFAAARVAGLATVPSLVLEADGTRLPKLREEVRRRAEPPAAEREQDDRAETANPPDLLMSAFGEISASLTFLNRAMPHAAATGFRGSVVADVLKVETERASTLAGAVGLLMRTTPASLEEVDCAAELRACRPNVDLGARLKGVRIEWAESLRLARTVADKDALPTGWLALLHAIVGITAEGDRVSVTLDVPRVRPAVILVVSVTGSALCACDPSRLLDIGWAEHPGGIAAAAMLAAAGRCARLHGGRLSLHPTETGYTASLVVPQPLSVL